MTLWRRCFLRAARPRVGHEEIGSQTWVNSFYFGVSSFFHSAPKMPFRSPPSLHRHSQFRLLRYFQYIICLTPASPKGVFLSSLLNGHSRSPISQIVQVVTGLDITNGTVPISRSGFIWNQKRFLRLYTKQWNRGTVGLKMTHIVVKSINNWLRFDLDPQGAPYILHCLSR